MQGEKETTEEGILAGKNKRKVSDYLEPDTVLLVSVALACLLYIVIS
jgi:hypothetical protein